MALGGGMRPFSYGNVGGGVGMPQGMPSLRADIDAAVALRRRKKILKKASSLVRDAPRATVQLVAESESRATHEITASTGMSQLAGFSRDSRLVRVSETSERSSALSERPRGRSRAESAVSLDVLAARAARERRESATSATTSHAPDRSVRSSHGSGGSKHSSGEGEGTHRTLTLRRGQSVEGGVGGGVDYAQFINPDLRSSVAEGLRPQLATACVRNAIQGNKFRLRHATPERLWWYNLSCSGWYTTLMYIISLTHLLLLFFEPTVAQGGVDSVCAVVEAVCILVYLLDIAIVVYTARSHRAAMARNITRGKVVTVLAAALDLQIAVIYGGNAGWRRVARLGRPMLVLLYSRHLRRAARPFYRALGKFAIALVNIALVLVAFSMIGIKLFGSSHDWIQPVEELEDCDFTFTNVLESLASLYVLVTEENYPCVMVPALRPVIDFRGDETAELWFWENYGLDAHNPNGWSRYDEFRFEPGVEATAMRAEVWEALRAGGYVGPRRMVNLAFFGVYVIFIMFILFNVLVAIVFSTYQQYRDAVYRSDRQKQGETLGAAFEMLAQVPVKATSTLRPSQGDDDEEEDALESEPFVSRTDWERLFRSIRPEVAVDELDFLYELSGAHDPECVDIIPFLQLVDLLGMRMVRQGGGKTFEDGGGEGDEGGGGDVTSKRERKGRQSVFALAHPILPRSVSKLTGWETAVVRSRSVAAQIVTSRLFGAVSITLVALDICIDCAMGFLNVGEYAGVAFNANAAFTWLYMIECALKLYGVGPKRFWLSYWNRYDLVVALLGALLWSIAQAGLAVNYDFLIRPLRIMRLYTAYRFYRTFVSRAGSAAEQDATTESRDAIANIFATLLLQSMPILTSFFIIIFLTIYVYIVVGMEIWENTDLAAQGGDARMEEYYGLYANFGSAGASTLLMLQMLVSSNWHEVMLAAERALEVKLSTYDPMTVRTIARVFFCSFMVLAVTVMLNLVLSVVVDYWLLVRELYKRKSRELKSELEQVQEMQAQAAAEEQLRMAAADESGDANAAAGDAAALADGGASAGGASSKFKSAGAAFMVVSKVNELYAFATRGRTRTIDDNRTLLPAISDVSAAAGRSATEVWQANPLGTAAANADVSAKPGGKRSSL